jgi:hypothetical protein
VAWSCLPAQPLTTSLRTKFPLPWREGGGGWGKPPQLRPQAKLPFQSTPAGVPFPVLPSPSLPSLKSSPAVVEPETDLVVIWRQDDNGAESPLEARRNEAVAAEGKTMIDDARLKAMKLVNDARETADQALSTTDSAAAKERLQELHVTLEEIEEDLKITELDHTLSELRSFQQRLHDLDAAIDREVPALKPVARKVEHAAKEIGIAVDAEAKVIPPV